MDSLPNFPEFAKIDLKHKNLLRQITANFPSYSDFNFVSMFSWDNEDLIAFSELNDNLVVKFTDYSSGQVFISFMGQNKLTNTINTLLDYCKENNLQEELSLIGQKIVDSLKLSELHHYKIKEDRDNHDYILSASLLSNIDNIHPKKRAKLRHFERDYNENLVSKQLDLMSEKTILEIEQLLIHWQKIREKTDKETAREFNAIRRSLKHADELGIDGFGTYIDGNLVAFTLFEILHDKSVMLHFGKSDTNYMGSNEAHQNRLASHLLIRGVELMNNEQDLGIEGLRNSKMEGKPVHFLRKYTISRT